MKLLAELNEFRESNLPRHEAHRAAVTTKKHRQLGIRNEPIKFTQFLIDEIDRNLLSVDICNLSTFVLVSTQLMCQQLRELIVTIVGGVNVHDDVSFIAVSVRKFYAIV